MEKVEKPSGDLLCSQWMTDDYISLINIYHFVFHRSGQSGRHHDGKSPLDCLEDAAICVAAAIKNKPKQADLHYLLGMIMEEQYYALDMFGLKKEV